jgi:gliding motility-associated-like protein
VLPQNDAPVIAGQKAVSGNEDQAVVLQLTDLTVTDVDNTYPSGFSLSIGAGANYAASGTTITPAANFSGTLTVPVTVSDGVSNSNEFNISVEISAVNDAPVITGQIPLLTGEDRPIKIELAHLTVTDVDSPYPTGFTLTVKPGTNYSVANNVVTPSTDFSGTLTVPVVVSDGISTSEAFNLQVTVEGSNDAPVITGQTALQVDEDKSLTIQLANLVVTDTDNPYPQGFTLSVSAGENYTVNGTTITPSKNFDGVLSVAVSVNDGAGTSNIFYLQVSVIAVNDAPVITGQNELSVEKAKSITIGLADLQVTDPDNNYPDDFSIHVSAGDNYAVAGDVVTPKNDFTGTLSIPVTVNDGELESAIFSLQLTVVPPPNVKPVIKSQVALTTYENQSLVLQLSSLVVVDPDNRYPDDFTMTISSGAHYTVNGNTITPEEDFSGTLNVKVTVSDKESTSDPFNVVIEVLPIADIPLITSQGFLRMNEDDSLVIDFPDLVVLDPDDSYPTGFTLTASAGSHYVLNGLLVKPERDFNGYLSIPVTVNDGANTSQTYQLLILVDAVNDAPVVTDEKSGKLFYAMGKGAMLLFDKITLADVDDDTLSLAEISFDAEDFEAGKDSLIFESSGAIRGVLDRAAGELVLFGEASAAEYQSVIRSVRYAYNYPERPAMEEKSISLTVNDGKTDSKSTIKIVNFHGEVVTLDIPTGFTPNGDGANDTWNIKSLEGNDSFVNAIVRVYNKRGAVVFESRGLDREWDGRMNGAVLPADTYFYTIDLNGAYAKTHYKGVVIILR